MRRTIISLVLDAIVLILLVNRLRYTRSNKPVVAMFT